MLRWLVASALVATSAAWVASLPPGTLAGRATRFSRGEALWAGAKKPKKAPTAGGFGSKAAEAKPEVSPKAGPS